MAEKSEPGRILASFRHRLVAPANPDGEAVVLLHGSGGDEEQILPFAREVAPDAVLLAVRGRIVQDEARRWYKRLSPVRFDQLDIRAEAAAFTAFVQAAQAHYRLDPQRLTWLGYSNGANLVGAIALLQPALVRRAVLLRTMPVLDDPPEADLKGARFLIVAGRDDALYAPFAPAMQALLTRAGAAVEAQRIAADHMLGAEDVRVVGAWLRRNKAAPAIA